MKRTHFVVCGATAALLCSAAAINAKDLTRTEVDTLTRDGRVMSIEKLDAVAIGKHPGGSVHEGAEIEHHRRGYVYEVEVTDANGVEWDLDINASTGKVLKDKKDD